MIRLLTLSVLALAFSASAATYYIDFGSGNDANNGTSTATPWKRHPFMANESVAYTPVAGDRFVFKGGVTWTASFPWAWNVSGSTPANRYYCYVDPAWGSGRAIMDGGLAEVSLLTLGGLKSNLYFADFEFKRNSRVAAVSMAGDTFITFSNCYWHQWYRGGASTDLGNSGAVYNNYAGVTGGQLTDFLITHSILNNSDGDTNYGHCIRGGGEVAYSYLSHASQLILNGTYSVHDCELTVMAESFQGDAAAHPNTLHMSNYNGQQGVAGPRRRVLIYNNYIHDLRESGGQVIYPNFHSGVTADGELFVYNNVVIRNATYMTFQPETYNASTPGISQGYVYCFNNTFHMTRPSGALFLRTIDWGPPNADFRPPQRFHYFNNHFIGPPTVYGATGSSPPDLLSGNNIAHTTTNAAATAHYHVSQFFAPSNSSATGINGASNLTAFVTSKNLPGANYTTSRGNQTTPILRRTTGFWDVGAYQYATANNPPVITAGQTLYWPVGSPLSYQILAVGTVVNWGAANLPSGLTVGSTSGLITGTPTVAGTNTVTLSATNVYGFDQETMVVGITNPAALIAISATSIAMGRRLEDGTNDFTITVTNIGGTGTTLTGSATNPTTPWTLIGDAGYSLANGATKIVTLRYSPTTYGTNLGSVSFTGGGGATTALRGDAYSELIIGTPRRAVETLVEAPFATNGNVIASPSETLTIAQAGVAVWGLRITNAGVITIYADVIATNYGTDSFFVGINGPPINQDSIWDIIPITPTGGPAEERQWNSRGNGTYDAPEFQPYSVPVFAGEYSIYLLSREANCQITNILVDFVATTNPGPGAKLRYPRLRIRH